MLVLTRKVGQKVKIGSDVVVKVLQVKGNRASLGIECPPAVSILRSEVCDRAYKSFDPCSIEKCQDEDPYM